MTLYENSHRKLAYIQIFTAENSYAYCFQCRKADNTQTCGLSSHWTGMSLTSEHMTHHIVSIQHFLCCLINVFSLFTLLTRDLCAFYICQHSEFQGLFQTVWMFFMRCFNSAASSLKKLLIKNLIKEFELISCPTGAQCWPLHCTYIGKSSSSLPFLHI